MDIAEEEFNPALFLSMVHHTMRYEDLDTAKDNLKQSKKKLNNGMKTLVKDNMDKFIAAKDEVDKLMEKGTLINLKSVQAVEDTYTSNFL